VGLPSITDQPDADTTHNIQNRQTSMSPAGFEPAKAASGRRPTAKIQSLLRRINVDMVKVKVTFTLYQAIQAQGGGGPVEYKSNLPLTSALDGCEWLTPRPGRFTPGKETRCILCRRLSGPQGRSGRIRKWMLVVSIIINMYLILHIRVPYVLIYCS